MKFLKEVNTGLLFLVIFLLILFACFNVYYQKIIDDLSRDSNKKQEQLTEITGRLSLEETKEDKISQLKEITEADIEFLEKDYNALEKEKSILEQKIDGKDGIGSCKASGNSKCPD